jgi:hypothetical protein
MASNTPVVDFTALSFYRAVSTIVDVTHTRVNDPNTEHRVWIRVRSGAGVMKAAKWLMDEDTSNVWWAIAS